MKTLTKWIRHNQGMFAALIIASGLLIWTFGCESSVTSLLTPDKMVSRAELVLEIEAESRRLESELDALQKRAALKMQQLDRADEIKKKLFEFAALTAQSGTVNPAGVLTLAGSVLGFGAVVDNRIKDKVIKNRTVKREA